MIMRSCRMIVSTYYLAVIASYVNSFLCLAEHQFLDLSSPPTTLPDPLMVMFSCLTLFLRFFDFFIANREPPSIAETKATMAKIIFVVFSSIPIEFNQFILVLELCKNKKIILLLKRRGHESKYVIRNERSNIKDLSYI